MSNSNSVNGHVNNDIVESKTPESSVDISCHNPFTGQIYTQDRLSEHQKQSQSDDKLYLKSQEIDIWYELMVLETVGKLEKTLRN